MVDAAMFSSASTEWRTPHALFEYANRRWGPLKVDAAATQANRLLPDYISREQDALKPATSWGSSAWVNPPYGRGLERWAEAAAMHIGNGTQTIVGLFPARTDTKTWTAVHHTAADVVLLRGRLTFKGPCLDDKPQDVKTIERGGRRRTVCGLCEVRVRATTSGGKFDQHIYDPSPFPSALVIWRHGSIGPARYEDLAREVWQRG